MCVALSLILFLLFRYLNQSSNRSLRLLVEGEKKMIDAWYIRIHIFRHSDVLFSLSLFLSLSTSSFFLAYIRIYVCM